MSVNNSTTKWVRLGDYIKRSMANNNNLKYGDELIEGVNSKGEFCDTKAGLEGINLKPYKIVQNGDFVYNPSRLNIGSLAYRQNGMCIVSHLYVVFRLNDIGKKLIVPEFLYLFFNRDEFLRLITYLNFGSQRPEFNFYDMSEIQIPLPDIDVQQKLVDTYNGLKALAEQNEAIIKPLTEACQAYIVDCKKKYKIYELGDWIERRDERNLDNKLSNVKGLTVYKKFIDTKADMDGVPLKNYKIVYPNDIAYVSTTNRNGDRIACGFCLETCLVSTIYDVLKIDETKVLSKYIFMWFERSEMDRYARYNSWGSAREVFGYDDLCRMKIPLPPIEVQQAIVNLYNCAKEAKNLANDAREKMKTLCPALVQRAING